MSSSKGLKNIKFGLLAQILTIGIGFILPRLTIVNLGSEANGLLSSVGSMLSYMSLLEAGVGMAALQSLYKPMANNDRGKINSIMAAIDHYYKRTGIAYLLIVFLLSIVYTFLINSVIPKTSIFLVIILSGLSGVLSYFFQGKFTIFLSAEGKSYVTTNITTSISIAVDIIKALLLMMGGGLLLLQIVYFGFNLIRVAVYALYMKNHYGWIDLKVEPDLDAVSQKNAVLVHQISGLIFSNTDVLILTVLTSLKVVSVYNMYAMVFGMIKAITTVLFSGPVYALGQTYNTDKEKFFRFFDVYEIYTISFAFSLYAVCGVMITPFLQLYTSGVEDINYIDPYLPWLFLVFYLLHNGRTSSGNVINFAQKFDDTKWRSILESAINLSVTIILTWKIGIYGAIIGTIVALFYRTNDMIIYASKILDRSPWITYRRWFLNVGIVGVYCFLSIRIHIEIHSYLYLLIVAAVFTTVIVTTSMILNSIFEHRVCRYVIHSIKKSRRSYLK